MKSEKALCFRMAWNFRWSNFRREFRGFTNDPWKLDPARKNAKIYSIYLDYWILIKLTEAILTTLIQTAT